jgi:hypothetical protein
MATAIVDFAAVGYQQDWVVPAGVTSILVEVWGAQGEDNPFRVGGKGGYATGTLATTPGQTLAVFVGTRAGFNGGGNCYAPPEDGGMGGGGSDVRQGGSALANRVIIAGGGGGSATFGSGGAGGGTTGNAGTAGGGPGTGGGGGTASAGGAGPGAATDGVLGAGGNGDDSGGAGTDGGGGGGGYYGGGGGLNTAGGGGGSGYTGGVTSASMTTGSRFGEGLVKFTYTDSSIVQTPTVTATATTTAINVSATHPAVTDPATQAAVATMDIHRQESVNGVVWRDFARTTDAYDVLADDVAPTTAINDYRIASRMNYRYRVVAAGANGTAAASTWSDVEDLIAATGDSIVTEDGYPIGVT